MRPSIHHWSQALTDLRKNLFRSKWPATRHRTRRLTAEPLESRVLLVADMILEPEADAYVLSAVPGQTFDSEDLAVTTPNAATAVSYLRFDLSDVEDPVVRARIRLWPTEANRDYIINEAAFVRDNSWSEEGPNSITWDNRPEDTVPRFAEPLDDPWPVWKEIPVYIDVTQLAQWIMDRGDMDIDGDVDYDDVTPFNQSPTVYENTYGVTQERHGDTDGDGDKDFDDIGPFIALLSDPDRALSLRVYAPAGPPDLDVVEYGSRELAREIARPLIILDTVPTAQLPVAADDAFAMSEDGPQLNFDVLRNDVLALGGATITSVTSPDMGGTATIAADGLSVNYTPAADFFGTEVFHYTIANGAGRTDVGKVTITVAAVNDDPTLQADEFWMNESDPAVVLAVLDNDSYLPDGPETLTISIVDTSSAGVTPVIADGRTIVYSRPPAFVGTDSFSYTVVDGNGGTAQATVTVHVEQAKLSLWLETTDSGGTPITSIDEGDTFQLRVWAQDIQAVPTGLFAAYLDVLYDTIVSVDGEISFGDPLDPYFTQGLSGDPFTDGLIDEVGGFTDDTSAPVGLEGEKQLVFSLQMKAESPGQSTFVAEPADSEIHENLLFGLNEALPRYHVEYGTASIDIMPSSGGSGSGSSSSIVAPETYSADSAGVSSDTGSAKSTSGGPPWQNPIFAMDVTNDGIIAPIDALRIINETYNRTYSDPVTEVLPVTPPTPVPAYFDVDGDGKATTDDAQIVHDYLNGQLDSFSAVGDFNGDGFQEIATWQGVQSWQVVDHNGVPRTVSGPNLRFFDQLLVGDFNADDLDDLAGRSRASGDWLVFLSNGLEFQGEVWGSWGTLGDYWQNATVGDFTGDGRDDFVVRDGDSGNWHALVSTGRELRDELWAQGDPGDSWIWLQSLDLNGDGRDDLLGREAAGNWRAYVSTRAGFDVLAPLAAATPTDILSGDYDGNGSEEVVFRTSPTGSWQRLHYGAGVLTIDASGWGSALAGQTTIHVADANQDGRDDILSNNGTSWLVALSLGSGFVEQNWGDWFDSWRVSVGGIEAVNTEGPVRAAIMAFESVYNGIEVQFYPGLMKGAQATSETGAGNPSDQAALLEDMLEASGIPAKIAIGSIRVPPTEAQAWTGATTIAGAEEILDASVGNATVITDPETQIVFLEFPHAWVRAQLPGPGGLEWQDIDPSWKFKDLRDGVPGILDDVSYDRYLYLKGEDVEPMEPPVARTELPIEYFEDLVVDYLADNHPGVSLAEVAHDGPIIQRSFTSIPSGVPFVETPSYYEDVDTLPDTEKHRVTLTLSVSGGSQLWTHTLATADVALERITVTYATAPFDTFAAQLRIGGTVVDDSGSTSIPLWTPVDLTLQHLPPGGASASFTHTQKAGEYIAIGLDARQFSETHLARLRREINDAILNSDVLQQVPSDPGEPLMGSILAYATAKYWHDFNRNNELLSGMTQAKGVRSRVGSGIATSLPIADYLDELGIQIPVVPRNMAVDLPNALYEHVELDGSPTRNERFEIAGDNASALEHTVIEKIINSPGVSTMEGLELALTAVPPKPVYVIQENTSYPPGVYTVTTLQGELVNGAITEQGMRNLLQLSTTTENDIVTSANQGFIITAPQTPTVLPNWSGDVLIKKKVGFQYNYVISGAFGFISGGYAAGKRSRNLSHFFPAPAERERYT